ncbi:MAG: response regulator [Aggregatilineales bacterium]
MDVLILEDSSQLLGLMEEALEIAGHHVRAVTNAKAGLELLNAHDFSPQAIVCDLGLPDMDGIAFIQHVRAHSVHSAALIIVMSGSDEQRAIALSAGAHHYISKPFSIQQLTDIIESSVSP